MRHQLEPVNPRRWRRHARARSRSSSTSGSDSSVLHFAACCHAATPSPKLPRPAHRLTHVHVAVRRERGIVQHGQRLASSNPHRVHNLGRQPSHLRLVRLRPAIYCYVLGSPRVPGRRWGQRGRGRWRGWGREWCGRGRNRGRWHQFQRPGGLDPERRWVHAERDRLVLVLRPVLRRSAWISAPV